jgi:hypothetical protein
MALLVLVTLLASTQFVGTSQTATALRVDGTVVAYSPFARLTILVGSPQPSDNFKRFHEDFLIQLDKKWQGLKKGQLVRLKYSDDTGTKPERPKDLFTHKRHWTFVVRLDASCTRNLENLLYYTVNGKIYPNMQLTSWAKPLRPMDAKVPCFIVSDGGFSKH